MAVSPQRKASPFIDISSDFSMVWHDREQSSQAHIIQCSKLHTFWWGPMNHSFRWVPNILSDIIYSHPWSCLYKPDYCPFCALYYHDTNCRAWHTITSKLTLGLCLVSPSTLLTSHRLLIHCQRQRALDWDVSSNTPPSQLQPHWSCPT
jgi:hypothetical protein